MVWENRLAHKVTLGYLKLRYSLPDFYLHADPLIKELPFHNDVTEFEDLSVNVFAGEFVSYLVGMQLALEEGTTVDNAYGALVVAGRKGDEAVSTLGDVVDAHFRFLDE